MTHTMTAYVINNTLWDVDADESVWESHNKLVTMWAHTVTPGPDLFSTKHPAFSFMETLPEFGTGVALGDSSDEALIKHLPADEDVVIYSLRAELNAGGMYHQATIEILHKKPGAKKLAVIQSGPLEAWSADVLAEACDEDEAAEILLHNVRVAPHEFVTVHRDHLEAFEAAAKFHKRPDLAKQFAELARFHAPISPATPSI